jgi:chaperonin cofactor prefoldin
MDQDNNKNQDLILVIQRRIEELTAEIQELVQKKQAYQQATKELDIRLTQLMGAIEELTKITKSEEPSPRQRD